MSNKSILFISKGAHAASTRYRALAYFDGLRARAWEPVHMAARSDPFSRMELLRRASQMDVVVVLRKTFSLPFFSLLRLCSRYLILDLDDAVFCRSNGSPSRTRQKRFAHVARRCQQIWAGNTYLAEAARDHNPSVTVMPTSLVPEKYAVNTTKPPNVVDLVWIGSSSTRKYLEAALPVLERLAGSFSHLRLKIVADFHLPSRHLPIVPIPWSEGIESEALSSAHIGIAPMPDTPWTQGKCGLKVLQYMAASLPVVSSPAGVNGEIVEHGITGFLAQKPEDWEAAIERLIRDPDLRIRMGEVGRKRVVEGYAVDVTGRKMAHALGKAYPQTP
ncbi:MAG: glycosyltransferase family 4 protein [Thermodesulfobacteriota bacterium]|nr:glycosyltransferase family 4 protein [Thermodesulfobacteriota bacterium]